MHVCTCMHTHTHTHTHTIQGLTVAGSYNSLLN